jgi:SET domain-containing protein
VRRRLSDRRLGAIVAVRRSAIHGRGVFAVREISEGEYIGTFDGPRVVKNSSHVLWVHVDGHGEPLGRLGRNLLRFLNHDPDCNASFDGFDLYARRRILAGEEVTIDYGW